MSKIKRVSVGTSCALRGCTSRTGSGEGLSLFSFPKDIARICKSTLKLSLSDKEYFDSSSESDEEEKVVKTHIKMFRKRRKKKKIVKKRTQPLREHSDSEITYQKSVAQTSLSVFDLIANEKIPCQILTQRSKTPQPKLLAEKKNEITKQLAEVQAKLYTLKNKLWFGVGQGDTPISWGGSQVFFPTSRSVSPQKPAKRVQKKSAKKADKNIKKEAKINIEKSEKPGIKYQNGLKRQSAVSWIPSAKLHLRKSKSLPDTSSLLCDKVRNMTLNDDSTMHADKSKKKKRRVKFSKKAKAVSNAKIFVAQPKD